MIALCTALTVFTVFILFIPLTRECGMAIVSWEGVCEGSGLGLEFYHICWRIDVTCIIEYAMT